MFYFGCWDAPGHFMYGTNGQRCERGLPNDFPIAVTALDGGFLPPHQPQEEGRLRIWRTHGWAIITFWDRSVDKRGGCNSSFVLRADSSDSDSLIVKWALGAFPKVESRLKKLTMPDGSMMIDRN